MALATVAWVLWQMPSLAQAEVYRCSLGGRTVYQDQPCAGTEEGAPYRAAGTPGGARTEVVPTGGPSSNAPPSTNLRTLHQQMLDAREQSNRVRTLYERDVQQAKAKAATMSLDQQRQLTKVLHARWDPKLQAAGRRERELSEALQKMCPGGATLNAQIQQCSK
jgi:hypothetical protein